MRRLPGLALHLDLQLHSLPGCLPAAHMQSCVVDPGAVKTEVWRNAPWFVQRAVDFVYAPPDGEPAIMGGCVGRAQQAAVKQRRL